MPCALVVDDDPVILSMAGVVLGEEGFEVDTASTAVDAMARLRRGDVDLLIVDLMLPELDGFALLSAMRNLGLARSARVVVVSGRDDPAAFTRGRELSVDDYLVKPVDVVDLVQLARAATAPAPF